MREVDDTHHAEDDGEPGRRQHEKGEGIAYGVEKAEYDTHDAGLIFATTPCTPLGRGVAPPPLVIPAQAGIQ
jgi:hypothetical protein